MVSLDGFIASPSGGLDWVIIDEELHRYINDQERAIDIYLYGRKMYEVMVDFWPTADEDPSNPAYVIDYAHIWKSKPKIVFSRTLENVGDNARLVREGIAEEITMLKKQPGKDLVLGGADIASTFMQLGLIDEYWLYLQPVVLGGGIPMFPPLANRIKLQLIETHTFNSGVVFLRYQVDRKGS
jgi:dihydrofolate reductase